MPNDTTISDLVVPYTALAVYVFGSFVFFIGMVECHHVLHGRRAKRRRASATESRYPPVKVPP